MNRTKHRLQFAVQIDSRGRDRRFPVHNFIPKPQLAQRCTLSLCFTIESLTLSLLCLNRLGI
jgi:hypothetical protein